MMENILFKKKKETNLKLHHVTACWCTYKTGTNVHIFLVHRTNIPWVLVVIDNLVFRNKGGRGRHKSRGDVKEDECYSCA